MFIVMVIFCFNPFAANDAYILPAHMTSTSRHSHWHWLIAGLPLVLKFL